MSGKRPIRRRWIVAVALLACVLVGTAAVWTNTLDAGTRFDRLITRIRLIVDPPPDRPIQATVEVTDPPDTGDSGGPTAPPETPGPTFTLAPGATPTSQPTLDANATPSPTPQPTPVRTPVDVKLDLNAKKVFASEVTDVLCAAAGTQIVLAINGVADNSTAFQRELAGRIGEWESREDSHNGGWGPAAIASALDAYGVHGYKLRAYTDRMHAVRDAAIALTETGAPVILMAWRGAHTWVMTGYRADADPTIFNDAAITGTYIYDPWYPRISTIWGPSDPPGTFQDWSEMQRNFLPWDRPEGAYPDRDGKFILIVPTLPLLNAAP
jgi:hypothetical protein